MNNCFTSGIAFTQTILSDGMTNEQGEGRALPSLMYGITWYIIIYYALPV